MSEPKRASYDFLIHQLLETSARRYPAKEAWVHGEERLTYADVHARVMALAAGLNAAGCARGERIGIYLEPSIAQALSIFAVSQAGGVFVPINHQLFPNQAAHIARDCGMRALITTGSKLAALAPELAELPSLARVVVVGDEPVTETALATHGFAELLRTPTPPRSSEAPSANDLAALLYTSGSTGKPKGVMLNHAQIMAGAGIVSTYLEVTEADRILAALPFSFDAGLNKLMVAVRQGATIVIGAWIFARQLVQLFVKERITGLVGVPTVWNLLIQPRSTLEQHELTDLRYLANTGGAMPQSVLAKLRAALPATRIYLCYGLTEAFRSTYLPPDEVDRRPTSIGKALPNTEILLVNSEGQPGRPGEPCELVHRGPTVSMGYWGQPELTARVLRAHPFLPPELGQHERVCYSGDLVKMDDEGFLYFIGRRDAMIKSSGFRISPTDVEEVLYQYVGVKEAAVIGIPDEALGYAVKALVVPKEDATVDPDALLAFCAEKMPRYMVPGHVAFLEAMPKTPNGKVDYPELRRREGITLG